MGNWISRIVSVWLFISVAYILFVESFPDLLNEIFPSPNTIVYMSPKILGVFAGVLVIFGMTCLCGWWVYNSWIDIGIKKNKKS